MKLQNGLYLIKSRADGLYLGEMQQHHKPGMVGVPLTVVSLPGGVRAPEVGTTSSTVTVAPSQTNVDSTTAVAPPCAR